MKMIKCPRIAPSFVIPLFHVSLQTLFRFRVLRFFPGALTAGVLALFLIAGQLHAQTRLWGLASDGALGFGTLFNLKTDGSDLKNFALPGIAGTRPQYTILLKGANGKFYGMTNEGGVTGDGVLFEYDPAGSGAYNALHFFEYSTGAFPYGSLVESGGKFYGMTHDGGDFGSGVLFVYDPAGAGTYTVLHHFDYGTDGGGPDGTLLEWNGKFYGTTFSGGITSVGVLFEFDPMNNNYTVLHDFQYGNGSYPCSKPILKDGRFYGMTYGGGVTDVGVIYEFDPSNNDYNVLYNFDGVSGGSPQGNLIETGGKFYGMTQYGGGPLSGGALFEFDPVGSGTYTVLHEFDYPTGISPIGDLLEAGGKFYGMTPAGGAPEAGVLFEYDPAGGGAYTVLHEFEESTGSEPRGSLMVSGGKFYGMTSDGGLASNGVLFEYDPAGGGAYTPLIAFSDAPIGNSPQGSLIKSGGKFYGTAQDGGTFDDGLLFEYDPAGAGTYTVLHHFHDGNGSSPYSGVVESGGKFYGTTRFGGDEDGGTLYVFDPADGSHTVLHHFEFTDGSDPVSRVIESGGKFYGTAFRGGDFGEGVLYQYDPAGGGSLTVLHHFDFTNGAGPYGGLTEMGGKFYGTAIYGGNNYNGVLYEYDPAGGGTFTVLHHLDYWVDGGEPHGTLLASGGKLYGASRRGGANDAGLLFVYDPAGSGAFTPLFDFAPATGSAPEGSLTQSGGKFYGVTTEGGDFNGGVVFEFDPAGSNYSVIRHLSYEDGVYPYCQLFVDEDLSVTSVSGKLIWENNGTSGVGIATVSLTGGVTNSMITGADGLYSFTVSPGADLTITPTKTANKTNGVTVADATRIQQHLAGINPITNRYKLVAADVNKSNSVTAADASVINQALLGNQSALQQFKTSWRFVPTSHVMNNPPWGFPEKIVRTDVNGAVTGLDFYGIKTGDVQTDYADPAGLAAADALVLNVADQLPEAGQTITLTFRANQFADLAALQLALRFDPQALALAAIAPVDGLPLTADNFGLAEAGEGLVRVAWSQAEGQFVSEAAAVFQVTFNVLQGGSRISDVLHLDEESLPGRAYTGSLGESGVALHFYGLTGTTDPTDAGAQLLQNQPNPFAKSTTIAFVLPEAGDARLRVFDATGRVLAERSGHYPAGRSEERFELSCPAGVLFYELVTASGTLNRTMTVLAR